MASWGLFFSVSNLPAGGSRRGRSKSSQIAVKNVPSACLSTRIAVYADCKLAPSPRPRFHAACSATGSDVDNNRSCTLYPDRIQVHNPLTNFMSCTSAACSTCMSSTSVRPGLGPEHSGRQCTDFAVLHEERVAATAITTTSMQQPQRLRQTLVFYPVLSLRR